ncbi:MAG: hypothetical protein ACT6RZ_00745 [Methylophilus sp.]|uniref:hypothetical protein n=1 Tax=Methylophilus sp. TaxID=29541 RepID=UPI00403687C7
MHSVIRCRKLAVGQPGFLGHSELKYVWGIVLNCNYKKYFPISKFNVVSIFLLLSGCVTTTYYTPPPNTAPKASVRFLAVDDVHYAVTMYEDDSCGKGLYSGFMGGPGYDLTKLLYSIPQSVKEYGNTLEMRDAPLSSPPLSYIERNIPAGKELVFVINRGYDHSIGVGTISWKSCNLTFSFLPKAETQYEVGFNVVGDRCNLSVNELEIGVKGKVVRNPVSTFRDLEQRCSVYTNP